MSIYVIECAGLLKIGYSTDPEKRVRNLFQSGSRYSAPRAAYAARGTQRLIHIVPGATKSDEGIVHQALDDYAIGCEWFVNEPPVLNLVRNFEPGDLPTPIERGAGPAYDALPYAERGGCNAELMYAVLAKRRSA